MLRKKHGVVDRNCPYLSLIKNDLEYPGLWLRLHFISFPLFTKLNNWNLPHISNNFFIEPKIISQPSFEAPFTSTNDPVNLIGCSIASHFNLTETEVYWLKNGYEKIHLSISGKIPKGGGVVKLTNNSFKVDEKYAVQGYYQCAVFNTRYMKEEAKSEKLHLQFQGNAFISFNVL